MGWIVVGVLAILYLVAVILIASMCLRPPRIPLFISPGALGAAQEEVSFTSEPGIELRGWWVEAAAPKAIAVLCHGYVMNRSELAPVAFQLWRKGVSSLLFDFRAHGRSRGGFSTIGWRERHDVAAAVAFAKTKHPGVPIMLVGSSMGSAASAFALAQDLTLANGLILDSAYSNLDCAIPGWWRFIGGRMAQLLLWPVKYFAAWMGGIRLRDVDVAQALTQISAPVFILHGAEDDLALPRDAERNFGALRNPEPVVWFDGCGHSEGRWVYPERYQEQIDRMLAMIAPGEASERR